MCRRFSFILRLAALHRPMFLLNSCLSLFSAAPCGAPLLPKLRGHFAEFLNNASSVGLRILSSSTCVGLRYGYNQFNSSFSRHSAHVLRYSFHSASRFRFRRRFFLSSSYTLAPLFLSWHTLSQCVPTFLSDCSTGI